MAVKFLFAVLFLLSFSWSRGVSAAASKRQRDSNHSGDVMRNTDPSANQAFGANRRETKIRRNEGAKDNFGKQGEDEVDWEVMLENFGEQSGSSVEEPNLGDYGKATKEANSAAIEPNKAPQGPNIESESLVGNEEQQHIGERRRNAGSETDGDVVDEISAVDGRSFSEPNKEIKTMKAIIDEQQKTIDEQKKTLESVMQQVDALIKQDAETRRLVDAKSSGVKVEGMSATAANNGSAVLTTGGTHYVRWGRSVCPKNVGRLYTGYMAGTYYSHTYGGTNTLCLHDSPQWGTTSTARGQYIYGTEYHFSSVPFSKSNNDDQDLYYHDALCAVCHTPLRSTKIMIPGRKECPTGWTFEYTGYIASTYVLTGSAPYSKSDFICLDGVPETRDGGAEEKYGLLLFPTRAGCHHSLPCPPYIHGRHITCVVCTK